MPEDKKIAEAVGLATNRLPNLGRSIEQAMIDSQKQVEALAKSIWEDKSLSEEDRRAKMDVVMSPEFARDAKLQARARVKKEAREAFDKHMAAATLNEAEVAADKASKKR